MGSKLGGLMSSTTDNDGCGTFVAFAVAALLIWQFSKDDWTGYVYPDFTKNGGAVQYEVGKFGSLDKCLDAVRQRTRDIGRSFEADYACGKDCDSSFLTPICDKVATRKEGSWWRGLLGLTDYDEEYQVNIRNQAVQRHMDKLLLAEQLEREASAQASADEAHRMAKEAAKMANAVSGDVGTYAGYNCTVDCGGHDAGYDWAMTNGVSDYGECSGNSDSFIEGCMAYVSEQEADQGQE
ncbi:hypothetical protein V3390_09340 [Luteimonas sp. FXH3W]|uniref:Uncharacterized protein n=1 Tax=Aquilutibacter rugosus TaxID=3115820 RepID=A0ABU7V2G5_9GAMM